MHAHINLDLGTECAEVMRGKQLEGIEGDFHQINDILVEMVGGTQENINRASSLLWIIDRVAVNADENFARSS